MTAGHAQILIVLLSVALVFLVVNGIVLWLHGSENRTLDRRMSVLETRVQSMPTHHDLLELREDVTHVAESIADLNGKTAAMTQMLRTIQEYLLEKDR